MAATTGVAAIADTLEQLRRSRSGLSLLVTLERPDDPARPHLPEAAHVMALTELSRASARRLFEHWRPDAILWSGRPLSAAAPMARRSGTPQIVVDAHAPQGRFLNRRRSATDFRDLTAVLTEPGAEADRLRRLGAPVETPGRLQPGGSALPCNDERRDRLSRALSARPAWLAVDVPPAEVDAIVAAHLQASRLSHRLMLLMVPSAEIDGSELARELDARSIRTGCTGQGDDFSDGAQVHIADGAGALGLWYRLAPITFFGGTLSSPGAGRPPFEAAALGSVVVHGPNVRAHGIQYARLTERNASIRVRDAEELGRAVERLLAPDRAAEMARAGWDVVSAGAAVSDRVIEVLNDALDMAEDA
ncbi:3-deoxy-D-manno-octulosonic-acid transferase [Tranquillimonas rosea]|uniref:3-deoxy-D-manno-octulosonic acid transferase n=1 Tax=Tranquillimonas rosea TaxID=641238 RepID=A0A1H9W3A9_9RHOB|nr:3-deoxy-D-manno-octulosonic-acid transferase [Tranquillimonas rosea]